jgi:integrase
VTDVDLNRKTQFENPFKRIITAVKDSNLYSDTVTVAAGFDFYIAQRIRPNHRTTSKAKFFTLLKRKWEEVHPGLLVKDIEPRHVMEIYPKLYEGLPSASKMKEDENGNLVRVPNKISYMADEHRGFKSMLRFLVGLQLCDPAILTLVKLTPNPNQLVREGLKPNREKRYVSEEDLENMLCHARNQIEADLIRLVFWSGARTTEICNMFECDITIFNETTWYHDPTFHKTSGYGNKRVLMFGPKCIEIITRQLNRDPDMRQRCHPVFRQPETGSRYRVEKLSEKCVKYCKRAGVKPFTMVALRRSYSQRIYDKYGKEMESWMCGHTMETAERHYTKENMILMSQIARDES